MRKTHFANADRPVVLYNLDMVLAVGYPSVQEKAANLLYFLVKDHVFADGNKRIAALLYLAFLHKNSLLVDGNGKLKVSNDGLAAMTILIAESKPEEKEIMVAVTMNLTGK